LETVGGFAGIEAFADAGSEPLEHVIDRKGIPGCVAAY
jgi:hypothetical protein